MSRLRWRLTLINAQEDTVSRVQLALNVANIDESIAFYSKLFAAEPAKVRPGYANLPSLTLPQAGPDRRPIKIAGVPQPPRGRSREHRRSCFRPGPAGERWHQDRHRGRRPLLLCAAGQGMGTGAWRGELGVLHRLGRRRDAGGPAGREDGGGVPLLQWLERPDGQKRSGLLLASRHKGYWARSGRTASLETAVG